MSAATTIQAVKALFDGDPTLAADFSVSGGLWEGGIPEDRTQLPLAALVHHGEVPEWNFEGQVVQLEGHWDIVLYAKGPDSTAAEALAADVMAVFDPSSNPKAGQTVNTFVQLPLTPTYATSAWVERQDYVIKLVDARAADSGWVWEITLPYKSFVARLI